MFIIQLKIVQYFKEHFFLLFYLKHALWFPRFRRQLSEPCNSFPPLPTMPREGRPMYQRQMSEPNIPFPPQGFKQEYHDPVYEHNTMVGGAPSQSFPPPLMIKQEPRDFAYDSGRPMFYVTFKTYFHWLAPWSSVGIRLGSSWLFLGGIFLILPLLWIFIYEGWGYQPFCHELMVEIVSRCETSTKKSTICKIRHILSPRE